MDLSFAFNDEEGFTGFTLFNSTLTDLITNVYAGEGLNQFQNIGQASLYGFELEVGRYLGNLMISTNYTYLQAQNNSADRETDYLPYRPKHRINGLLNYSLLTRFEFRAEGSYTADQYYQNPDNLQWEELNDIGLINLKFEFRVSPLIRIYLRGNNLYDTFYFSEYGIPMPGRELIFGVKLEK